MKLFNLVSIRKKDIVSFLFDLGIKGAMVSVPTPIKLAYEGAKWADQKFGKKLYGVSGYECLIGWICKYFTVADSEEQSQMLEAIGDLSDPEVGELVKEKTARLKGQDGSPLTVQDLSDAILAWRDAARAARQPKARGEPAEAVRRSLNDSLKARGKKPIEPMKMSAEQRAVGRMVTASMIRHRRQRVPTPAQPNMPPIPGYQMLRALGRGTYGTVYLAIHEATGETRAIKFGALDDPDALDREMTILQNLDHPNLVRYRDHGRLKSKTRGDRYYWIAMDYLGENNLAELLSREHAADASADDPESDAELVTEAHLQMEQVLIVAENILRGLAYLHERQIMHRDLKPENVMVDNDFCIRLIDFGLAKQLRVDGKATMGPTASGDAIGTPRYMSPEQFMQAKNLTLATDVWSFGAILYELFVGKPLFEASNQMALGHEIMTRRLRFDNPDIPLEMRPFLERCLERDASARFANAQIALKEFCIVADAVRRRLHHEYYKPIWMAVFDKRLIERFVTEHLIPFDGTTVAKFSEFAARHGISGLDTKALGKVLPLVLAAQREAESAARKVRQARAALKKDVEQLAIDEMARRTSKIERLEEAHVAAIENVTAQIRRELASEVEEWDRVQAKNAERLGQLEAERKDREEQNQQLIRYWLKLAAYAFPVVLVVLGLSFALLHVIRAGYTRKDFAVAGIALGVFLFAGFALWVVHIEIEASRSKTELKTHWPLALLIGGILAILCFCLQFLPGGAFQLDRAN